ncbi:hypothetical protein [Carboxylicivirga sp. N1Y90]|uniref:hypothetical protein n=1 Tax=Carboxylicivirga fragile TaxID=3417571 RepID=UPI003D348B46|nr:hypothetical protein [Marinilabiliaceae bacterium N1Y90]
MQVIFHLLIVLAIVILRSKHIIRKKRYIVLMLVVYIGILTIKPIKDFSWENPGVYSLYFEDDKKVSCPYWSC